MVCRMRITRTGYQQVYILTKDTPFALKGCLMSIFLRKLNVLWKGTTVAAAVFSRLSVKNRLIRKDLCVSYWYVSCRNYDVIYGDRQFD